MPKRLTRRQVLHLGLLTGAVACAPTANPPPTSTVPPPTRTPLPPQPTATCAPAATAAPGSAATLAPTATQSADAALIQNITQTALSYERAYFGHGTPIESGASKAVAALFPP